MIIAPFIEICNKSKLLIEGEKTKKPASFDTGFGAPEHSIIEPFTFFLV